MVTIVDIVFIIAALGSLYWGFDRYRTRFVKTDLLIGSAIAIGLSTFVILPGVFRLVGSLLDIQQRFVVGLLMGILSLIALVFYIISRLREIRGDITELNRKLSIEQAPKTDGGPQTIYVVIPAFNEGDTIRSVIESLPETVLGYEVQALVVSDGSSDDTVEQAQYDGATVVEHHVNQGQGGALKTGFEIAMNNDASMVVTMDGDGQHSAGELAKLIEPIDRDEADFVVGSRHLGQDDSGNSVVRDSGIRVFTTLINILTKADITDCTNGYRAIRGTVLHELTLTEERFSAPELLIEARKNGLRIKEVPVTVLEREEGETKKPKLGYATGLTRAILATWFR